MTMMTLIDVIRGGSLDGYTSRPHPLAPVARDDRDYCEHSDCPKCGHQGREYRPFIRQLGRTTRGGIINYVFYACCKNQGCQHAEEL